ncbi:hypothetical protein AWC38_SpisGene25360 [Stylophora pistillata]|uniref:G2/M phase-specific E3 ubiquitin-protein ligase n=1 Tax=Stylophora pistillata TaxID=50429 RepID=A0A2B4R3P4_STYPI|nr:hypothetical protein AWC38_SpisGene25360 [Stylophora pistillata]
MFCSGCGQEKLAQDANYCSKCGTKYSEGAKPTGAPNKKSFAEFRKRKEDNRTQHFHKKSKLNTIPTSIQDVTIQIGLMATKDGEIRVKRGSNLPLKVSPVTKYDELREKAVEKHSVFNTDILNRPTGFKLLYPDKRIAEKVPGTNEEFVLKLYKDKLGKPYSRITLYLATHSDYLEHLTSGLFDDEYSEGSDDYQKLASSSTTTSTSTSLSIENGNNTSITNPAGSTPTSSRLFAVVEDDCAKSITTSFPTPTTASALTNTSTTNTSSQVVVFMPTPTSPNDDQQPSTSGLVECPICLELFCSSDVEEHAASCSAWLLEDEQPYDLKADSNNETTSMADYDPKEAKRILKDEITKVMGGWPTIQVTRVSLRRKFLWEDFKSARQKKIQPTSVVKVVFVGEPCVDDGGPKRELFTELLSMMQTKYFDSGYPTTSGVALASNDFKLCGEIMGMSILQGGPAPNFLAPPMANYILGKELSPIDIKDSKLKEAVDNLSKATTDAEVRESLMSERTFEVLGMIGYRSIPQRETITSAKAIVQYVDYFQI